MSSPMFLAIYVSTANKLFSDQELAELLEQSRKANRDKGITGLLLYKDGCFMQFLEGAREDVLFLLNKIKVDPRHHGVIVVLQDEHGVREFSDWAMAFHK